ncbi:leucine zipper putative tumor suppressor 2 [Chionomys nivalis]|uniref:leucine zipper putative tumor suppressor 2 n=1 Tax=Chionomys nivalis TaxID=269649 RepID=UPI002596D128|nr:leucine zipper putative tumor suppressor 2 [Chionomys nivalis]XP_057633094.1 leucine zipper putative tumor suppressor 2 [Chionomys nivalis]XP_057633095.1 leucine zipper putative tumor suppressor 2 [Chionomys nivalis]XP_057633096.1 leucine zipper putative tumor suppressor 2 [Chionomys nivalis]XP_057633098.1 leucine zipper putative tumor suppressor 2 [Chionomys nivalis]XP_057633099.1 leucine zipper putative tumor suppressor 2 [Chionomys nivalis]
MAIVHTLPLPLEPARETATAPQAPAMGSVSSLISGRPCPGGSAPPRHHGVPGPTFFRQQDGLLRGGYEAQEPLCPAAPPRKAVQGTSFTYINEDFRTESPPSPSSDVEDPREQRANNAHLRGPPPKLIPVSGKLEKNMEKILIRPTAFKPVLPKPRGAPSLPGFLGPRAAGLSGSQGSLTQLFGGPASSSSSSSSSAADKPLALSGWASGCPSGTPSDSGRNSLSSLPTYSTGGAEPTTNSPGGHLPSHGPSRGSLPGPARGVPTGPSHSDSGRSSSSKSTGSLGGRVAGGVLSSGARASPGSSSGGDRSPPPPPPPPPSDEALLHCVLEGKLRDREAELPQLRDGMEESEATMCQAFGARQRHWPREREDCAAQAQQATQRVQRAQQLLQLQVFQLQQEKRQLQDDFAQLLQEREQLERRCATFEREQRELGPRLEETKWEVCQKSGEISLLKQQLKESQAELVQKGSELVALRVALREARAALRVSEGRARGLQEAARARELELEACSQELQRYRQEAERLREKAGHLDAEAAGLREPPVPPVPSATTDPFLLAESDEVKVQRAAAGAGGSLRAQVERLRQELQREQRRGDEQRDSFEGERLAWQAEKEQVIRYQKQLQHNYIQMYRRNRQLEQELQQLSLELEARELADLGLAEPAPCICLEEITATEI